MTVAIKEVSKNEIHDRRLRDVINVIIAVATDVELDAATHSMSPLPGNDSLIKYFCHNQTYYIGVVGVYPAALVKVTMMGALKRDASLSTVSEAIKYWRPNLIVMEGIAFGRDKKKQQIGDILVSETLSQYETAKHLPGGIIINRGYSVPSSSVPLNRFTQDSHWFNSKTKANITVRKCEILTGEKLIDDEITRDALFARYPNAQGGEMEGSGVYAACDKEKVNWIICKSICDWADGSKDDTWQALAANNAAQYVAHIFEGATTFNSIGVYSIDSRELSEYFKEHAPNYHDIRGEDIVKIIYPKHEVVTSFTVSKPKERIYYQFVQVRITEHINLGYLFFEKPSKINQDRTIKDFLTKYDGECDSLVVCSPRIKSPKTGKDEYRLDSIEGKFMRLSSLPRHVKVEFSYVEDMVWDHCLRQESVSLEYDIPDEKYFIDQKISHENVSGQDTEKKSLDYFSDVLNAESRDKPLIAVIGGAGVGKTTLCHQLIKLIALQDKRKAIYISSSEVIASSTGQDVFTVTDLYRLSYGDDADENDSLLDPANLEINISCGNIVVIIDGLDEIEAKLKERFDFDSFIQDAVNLNESYNNCAIVVTSRDYYKDKYVDCDFIELLSLFGFDDELASRYFKNRLPAKLVKRARKQLTALNISVHGHYPPVILSLICDIEDCLLEQNRKSLEQSKRNISAILYYYFGSVQSSSRNERSDRLLELFDNKIQYMFVYGAFYPLGFSKLEIRDSGFYDYENFENSGFPTNETVFFFNRIPGYSTKSKYRCRS